MELISRQILPNLANDTRGWQSTPHWFAPISRHIFPNLAMKKQRLTQPEEDFTKLTIHTTFIWTQLWADFPNLAMKQNLTQPEEDFTKLTIHTTLIWTHLWADFPNLAMKQSLTQPEEDFTKLTIHTTLICIYRFTHWAAGPACDISCLQRIYKLMKLFNI